MDYLIDEFIERYLSRAEIIHRLPVSRPISSFWPALQEARRARATELALKDQAGRLFWFVLNPSIERQCDAIAALARRDALFDSPALLRMADDAVIDEAVFSSMIEGAFTSREAAANFLRRDRKPKDKSEQMVKNNYDALTYALGHLDEEITEDTIVEIARIVTRSAAEEVVEGYRKKQVYVMGREDVVYRPPEAARVPEMMRALAAFIHESELHPVLKACAAHFYRHRQGNGLPRQNGDQNHHVFGL